MTLDTLDGRVVGIVEGPHPMGSDIAAPFWSGRLTEEDLRGLTPLIFGHVNPHGRFELDMDARLPLGYGASREPLA